MKTCCADDLFRITVFRSDLIRRLDPLVKLFSACLRRLRLRRDRANNGSSGDAGWATGPLGRDRSVIASV